MATVTDQPRAIQVPGVLEFARTFRAAARAVGFYPPAHPVVVASLEAVHRAVLPLTRDGALCLTILPDRFLAAGIPVEGAGRLVSEFSAILHHHGIGALLLNERATPAAWQALLAFLSKPSDEVRTGGGIQRQWKALRHRGPGILEVDFKELLLGNIGGDFTELSAVIGHYLETVAVGQSLGNDVVANLTRALDKAPDDERAVEAVIHELRTAAHLIRVLQPEQFDAIFRQAASVAGLMTEATMAGLLAARGTPPAILGTVDVAAAFIEHIPDDAAAAFMAAALTGAGHASALLTDVVAKILPDPARRRASTQAAYRAVAASGVEAGFVERWAEIEQQLTSFSDRQFVPDAYARELASAKTRSANALRIFDDSMDRISTWVDSVDDAAIRRLDLTLLSDLSRVENDAFRWRDVLAILRAHIGDAAEAGDWEGAAVAAEAIARVAADVSDGLRSPPAIEVLQECARNWTGEEALARLADGLQDDADACGRLLTALGPACIPGLVRRWSVEGDMEARVRLEAVVAGLGRPGRDALLRLLSAGDADVRCGTIRLLSRTGGHEHLPAMHELLADPAPRIRREALSALAGMSSERGWELAADGISLADATRVESLLDALIALGPDRAVPVLRRLVPLLDRRRVPLPIWLTVIEGFRRGATPAAASGLASLFDSPLWRSPVKTLRIRSAARRALVAMGAPAAETLRGVSRVGGHRG